jgi:hypothetical protein
MMPQAKASVMAALERNRALKSAVIHSSISSGKNHAQRGDGRTTELPRGARTTRGF